MKRLKCISERKVPRRFNLPWGSGNIVEEASIMRPHWEPVIQLLRFDNGSKALRFCVYSGKRFSRMPLIISEEDIEELKEAISKRPEIRKLIQALG